MNSLQIRFNGTGNAWPVLLGTDHPAYNRKNSSEMANTSISVLLKEADDLQFELLLDAGHGAIQSLLENENRIPDLLVLSHPHLDHTLSADWIIQSYVRTGKGLKYPVYATRPCYDFFIQSYPHLEDMVEFRELVFGKKYLVYLDHR